MIGYWTIGFGQDQPNLLLSNQARVPDGSIYGAIFPWLRDTRAFLCLTISEIFHAFN